MTRSKQILTLLISLAALAIATPVASAGDADRVKWNTTEQGGKRGGSLETQGGKVGGTLDPNRRHARSLPTKPRAGSLAPTRRHARVIGPRGIRVKF